MLDQIPDFSDVAPAFAPHLSLQCTSTEFHLTITGEPDATYSVQTTASLAPPVWLDITNITAGTVPYTMAVRPGDGSREFWRATYP